jgi:hypothetical protein
MLGSGPVWFRVKGLRLKILRLMTSPIDKTGIFTLTLEPKFFSKVVGEEDEENRRREKT